MQDRNCDVMPILIISWYACQQWFTPFGILKWWNAMFFHWNVNFFIS